MSSSNSHPAGLHVQTTGKSGPHCGRRGGSPQFAQQLESAVTAPPLVGCVVWSLEEHLLQYGAVKNVRWVASKSRALKAPSRNLPLTYVHVEHASANNRNADEVGKAQRTKKTIQNVRFVNNLHLMQDFLALVVATFLSFQQITLLIVDVPNHIDQLIMKLKHLKSFPGKHMGEFYEKLHEDATFGNTGYRFQRSRPTCGGTVRQQTTPANRDHYYPDSLLFVFCLGSVRSD